MANKLVKMLQESGNRLEVLSNELEENNTKLVNAELKINLLKSKLVASHDIVNLPNQTLRDAEVENRLQTDSLYSDDYRAFLLLKLQNKVLYTKWTLALELNKNLRVMLMRTDNSSNEDLN